MGRGRESEERVTALSQGSVHIRKTTKRVKGPWVCIGCGKLRAKRRRHYCRVCKRRLGMDWALDVDDVPTKGECERVCGRQF